MTSTEWEALAITQATSGNVFDWTLRAHEALVKPVIEASSQLRHALWEAEHASPDERQDANWVVTRCIEALRKAINVMDDGEEA